MNVLNAANRSEEIGKIVGFREPGKLRSIVQPNINDLLHTRIQKAAEKAFGRRFREAYGEEILFRQFIHSAAIGPLGSGRGSENATFLARSR